MPHRTKPVTYPSLFSLLLILLTVQNSAAADPKTSNTQLLTTALLTQNINTKLNQPGDEVVLITS